MLYHLLLGALWIISLLPFFVLYLISDFFFFLGFHVVGYRKKVVYTNLKNAYPDKTEAEIHRIARTFYKNLFDTLTEMVKLIFASEATVRGMCEFRNDELLEELYNKNSNLIIVQGHYFNWELSLMMGGEESKYNRYVVYKPLSDKISEKLIFKLRKRFNTELLAMHETLEFIKNYGNTHAAHGPALFQFGADQSPMKHKIEYWTTFMNRETPFFLGPEKLAVSLNLPVVFLDIQRVSRGKYYVEYSMLAEQPTQTSAFEITEKYVWAIEDAINKNPSNWLWSHKRWKHKKDS